jgi:hypothetical protein
MKAMHVCGAALALLIGIGTEALAGPDRPVARVFSDPSTGARISIFSAPLGEGEFEIANQTVSIRKRVTKRESLTTVRSAGEEITVALTPTKLVARSAGQELVITTAAREESEALRAWLGDSPAVRRAIALLGAVHVPVNSPLTVTLAMTRLQLQAMSGDVAPGRDARELAKRILAQASTLRAGDEEGPTECWVQYAKEAIQAWIEYEQCVDGTNWYDVLGLAGCLAVYDIRAIGAFSWWMTCVGFRSI